MSNQIVSREWCRHLLVCNYCRIILIYDKCRTPHTFTKRDAVETLPDATATLNSTRPPPDIAAIPDGTLQDPTERPDRTGRNITARRDLTQQHKTRQDGDT